MQLRARLLMGASALLYLGPLLAGLAGAGWASLPVFTAIFMLWLLVLRPYDFPQTAADWRRPEAWLIFATQVVIQVLLVTFCFGAGRGIGGMLGFLPVLHPLLPIAVSALAIPLGRLVWDPKKMHETNRFLDDALAQIDGMNRPAQDKSYVRAMLNPLNGLPDDVPEDMLLQHLNALRNHVDEGLAFEVLLQKVNEGKATLAGRRALMVMASDGAAIERAMRPDMPLRALQALRGDEAAVAALAGRLTLALQQDSDIWPDCPNPAYLKTLAVALPGARAELEALIAAGCAADPDNRV
jgi:hypothetical protein